MLTYLVILLRRIRIKGVLLVSDSKLLEVTSVSKRFPGVQALRGANFSVKQGEIHALIGANGAGKSTLIKILAGVEKANTGEIRMNGEIVDIHDANDARQLGLAFIHQELALVPRMTVAENLALGVLPNRFGVVTRRKLKAQANKALSDFLPDLNPNTMVGDLPVATQWLVSLARVSLQEAKVIFLDEPTAALGAQEVEILFQVIKEVTAKGTAVVFISHRLQEILDLCDRVTALRSGTDIGTHHIDEVGYQNLVDLVAGDVGASSSLSEVEDSPGLPILEINDLCAGPLQNVTFELREGEVLGVGGLVGSGRTELLETIFGARIPESGTIKLEGETLQFTQPADAVAKGIAMLPENRRDQALFSDRSIRVNTVISHLSRFARGILKIPNVGSENEKTKEQIDRLMIKATGPRQLVRELSGGNQQKVVVGRWLCGEVKVFLVDEPTKGVDIAGKSEILLELRRLAASGSAVIVVSSQLEEIADVSDRVLVLNEGKVAGLLDGPTTENEILQACYKAEAA